MKLTQDLGVFRGYIDVPLFPSDHRRHANHLSPPIILDLFAKWNGLVRKEFIPNISA